MKKRFAIGYILATSLMTAPLSAAVFNVNDEAGLSAAITTSNSNGEDDTINIAAGTITLTTALPQVVDDSGFGVSIIGAGQTDTIIEAGALPQELGGTGTHERRVFFFNQAASVTLTDMTIRRGRVIPSLDNLGGANILFIGSETTDFTMERCLISKSYTRSNNDLNGGSVSITVGTTTINDCEFTDTYSTSATKARGGGLGFVQNGIINQTIMIKNSFFSGNTADTTSNTGSAYGGGLGVVVGITPPSSYLVEGCTFTGNQVTDSSPGSSGFIAGGGVAVGNLADGVIRNCTISNNQSDGSGGGLVAVQFYGDPSEAHLIENCTITNNTAADEGGGFYSITGTLRSTIIAGNSAPTFPDIVDDLRTNLSGYNLIGDGTGVVFDSSEATDQIGTSGSPIDPLLGPLADNGGPTLTHALLTGSPAIDAGTDQAIDTTTITTDQRGNPRVSGSQADIGAFELGVAADTTPPTGSFSAVTSPRNTNFGTVTVTFSEDVQNVDITDFALTRDLSIVDISGLSVSTVAADEYTIDLSGVTGAEGGYFFGYDGSNNDIQDLAGNDVTGTPTIIAIVDTTVPTSSAAITDATQVGGDIDGGSYTAADNVGGSGLASVELYVKEPGQAWASAGAVTGGTFSFTPTQGDGTYEFATVATDNATNGETAPTGSDSGDIAVVYNDAANSSYAYATIADGSFSFPMTDALDVVITFSGGASGGPITVSRTTGDNAPVGLDAAKLIDEFLSITGTFSGTASILWNFDGASDDTLSGSLTTVYQFDGGSQAGQYTVTPSGDSLTINGVTAFSEWYAGDVSATEDEWSVLD